MQLCLHKALMGGNLIIMREIKPTDNIKTTFFNRKNRHGMTRLLSVLLAAFMMLMSLPSAFVFADDADDAAKRSRTVYVHAQGKNPTGTSSVSTVYMGETADIYVAVDNPNKGKTQTVPDPNDSTKTTTKHLEPQYDLNGIAVKITYDPNYFKFEENNNLKPNQDDNPSQVSPINYKVPTEEYDGETDSSNFINYYVLGSAYSGSGLKKEVIDGKTYNSAYLIVFYQNGYVPQKIEGHDWYNLVKLPLTPLKSGSTNVFIDVSSGGEHQLQLFAKNVGDEVEEQYFNCSAVNGGYHQIIIKDKLKPSLPTANPPAGKYTEKQDVRLDADDDCKIFYSINGGAEMEYDRQNEQPIEIEATSEITCYAVRTSDNRRSDTVKFVYEIIPKAPHLFDSSKRQIPNIYNESSPYKVYVGDSETFNESEPISASSDVYYTFSTTLNEDSVADGSDPETEWVKVRKTDPTISIDKRRTIKLITVKTGEKSDIAYYYLGVLPKEVEASPSSGDYTSKIDVELTCATAGAKILYTTDGSDPVTNGIEYTNKITLGKDTTVRAAALYDGLYSNVKSFYYRFDYRNDMGVEAFYPSGTYEGSVKVTLTANNPANNIKFRYDTDPIGQWRDYTDVLEIDKTTKIIAKVIDPINSNEGDETVFDYIIKPKAPVFSPPTTQFTSNDIVSIYCNDSTKDNTGRYKLFYTTDGSDPITSPSRKQADDVSDMARVDITGYTVIKAVVLLDDTTYSTVVTQSYDVVSKRPVQPLVTLEPGKYIRKISSDTGYTTQFVPVPEGTKIYYTISYDGTFKPDPIPGTADTKEYKGENIEVKGKTIIKAVAVNVFNVKSDIGIFGYTVAPEPPQAAPSAQISGTDLPIVPVDAVKGSKVIYTLNDFNNEFECADGKFYINTKTGEAFSDAGCTVRLGSESGKMYSDKAELVIKSELDGVMSSENMYVYKCGGAAETLAAPYADKNTGVYEEIKQDDNNTLLKVNFYSLNNNAKVQYRLNNAGEWIDYNGGGFGVKEYTVVQLRAEKNGNVSDVASYVYDFVPLAPIITLPSGRYVKSDKLQTEIKYDDRIPTNADYSIYYRTCFDERDYIYSGKRDVSKTMSFKAYVKNEKTGAISKSTVHYYIIEPENSATGSVYVANPYDANRLSADVLDTDPYADGIKLVTQNKNAEIHYYYSYTKTDGTQASTNSVMYDNAAPIKVNSSMKDITIYAWLEDANGRIDTNTFVHHIEFVKLNVPQTSLGTKQVQFPKGTKYTLLDEYKDDEKTFLYYTTDGSDPTDETNANRKLYDDETLDLSGETTVKAVYMNACGICINCIDGKFEKCIDKIYSKVGSYTYTVPTRTGGGGSAGGINKGSSDTTDNTRKYTKDIFGIEHPTHIGYINGYPDGSVKPDGEITREEIAAVLYRVYSKRYDKPFSATGTLFPDVTMQNWSVTEVEYMAQNGVIKGYPDGEFNPTNNLTRAEFAALISRYIDAKEVDDADVFGDLSNKHWAYKNIMSLYRAGLIQGYEDGTFKPENEVTRAEVVTVINKILGRNPSDKYVKTLDLNPFTDLIPEKWYYTAMLEATVTHDYYLDDKNVETKWENCK